MNCKDNGLIEVCNVEQVVEDPLMLGDRMAKFQKYRLQKAGQDTYWRNLLA